MAVGKSSIQLIREFFGIDKRPVSMDEMKALTKADRSELGDAIALQQGLVRKEEGGQVQYHEPVK